jgi:lipopolysaccharide/colanic/teichoic acid biosynthesis glycosyltransferase
MEGVFMENLGYLLEDDDISPAVKRRSRTQTAASAQLENVSKTYLFVKRLADVVLSILAVIVLSVPMLLIALAVFLQDFHNPIFKQLRVTKDGRFFTMYKFRTMCVNAEQKLEELRAQNEADGPVFKMKKDPRVTPIGRFLRKTSLDELPQFFNVLNGSMSSATSQGSGKVHTVPDAPAGRKGRYHLLLAVFRQKQHHV